MKFQAITLYAEEIGKKTTYTSGIRLNESNLFAEGWFDLRKTILQFKNMSPRILPEHFFFSIKAIIMCKLT